MKRLMPIVIFLVLFFGGFATASIFEYFNTLKENDAILYGEIIEVELNKVSVNSSRTGTIYSVGYEFYDEKNIYYWGFLDKGFSYVEEARSYLGKKIEIHIDGKGNSIPVGQKPKIGFALTFAIVMPTIFVLLIIALIIVYIKYRKWCKKMEPIWYAKRKEAELSNSQNNAAE